MIETIEFILKIADLTKTVENYQKIHEPLLEKDFASIAREYEEAAQTVTGAARPYDKTYMHVFEEGEFVALKQKGLNRESGNRKKNGPKEDAIKKIMTQCDFIPDYVPNFKNLLKGDSSIHDLKLQKSTRIIPDKMVGTCQDV